MTDASTHRRTGEVCTTSNGHSLVDGALFREKDRIVARCKCGWSSEHFTSLSASVAFLEHRKTASKSHG